MQTFGKRCQSAKRDPNCAVVIRGWLNKKVLHLQTLHNFMSSREAAWLTHSSHPPTQDSAGLKLWKRRWFVLSNYCLFYYKGSTCRSAALGFLSICVFLGQQLTCRSFLQPQTAERNPCWAAFPSRATKSSSAHPENARTGSSPSRYSGAKESRE